MFGYHKAKREARRLKRSNAEEMKKQKGLSATNQAAERKKEMETEQRNKMQVGENVKQSAQERANARQQGRAYAEDVIHRDVEGLTPEKRRALQSEANYGIERNFQSANRKLLGEQSMRGIQGKGGVGYAQQRDLQKMENEEKGRVHRDLDKLNSDLALKKLAATFNIEQGEAAQSQLDKQLAIDELDLGEERKRQRRIEENFNRQFNRI